jgi:ATP-binding cassette subfamily B protein
VAHIVSDQSMYHFVVVYKMEKDCFVVGDPSIGKRIYNQEDFFKQWTGYIVTFEKTKKFKRGDYTKGTFAKYLNLLNGQYKKLLGILLISVIVAFIGVMGAFVFEIAIDGFATESGYVDEHEYSESGENNELTAESFGSATKIFSVMKIFMQKVADRTEISSFNWIFIFIISLYLLQVILELIRGYLIISISKKIDIRLTLLYYNHIIDLPVQSIALRQTGEYLSRFTDADSVRTAISNATITLVLDSLMAVGGGIILYLLNGRLFFVSFFMVIIYAIICGIYCKPVKKSNRQMMENNAILQSYFKESIEGINTIKASCASNQVKERTTSKFNDFINSVFKSSMISMSQDVVTDAVELIGTIIILWIGFSMVLQDKITVGVLITFYALISYFTGPIKNLIQLQPTIQKAFVAAERLNDILELEVEKNNVSNNFKSNDKTLIDTLEFRHVYFRYGNRELTLKDVCLQLKRGEKIAIVGESGSGKTTIAKLLLGFYEPENGEILINNESTKERGFNDLRRNIAYVDQNTFLFADTIKNNMMLGNEEVSDEEIWESCIKSHISEFIQGLPLKLDTPIDENGENLSGGQKQRIAIARALLRKPQILILDEATSNLDTITEEAIKDAIFKMNDNLTCIIIAHRLSTIRQCDCIYVMENGHVVEYGSHDELVDLNGKYAQLLKKY